MSTIILMLHPEATPDHRLSDNGKLSIPIIINYLKEQNILPEEIVYGDSPERQEAAILLQKAIREITGRSVRTFDDQTLTRDQPINAAPFLIQRAKRGAQRPGEKGIILAVVSRGLMWHITKKLTGVATTPENRQDCVVIEVPDIPNPGVRMKYTVLHPQL